MKPQNYKIITLFFLLAILAYSASAACSLDIKSKNTADFLNEITTLNDNLNKCPVPLDSASKAFLGSNGAVKLTIGSSEVYLTISGGAISAISTTGVSYGFNLVTDTCSFDSVLGSDNRYGAFAYFYTQGKIKIVAKGFWNVIKMAFARPFFNSAMKKSAVKTESKCLKDDGAVCNNGGECKSGNCIGVGQGPPWTYQCSCDPNKYMTNCPKPQIQVDSSGKRPAGELCDNGGQCKTGNCIGVGQGPPWTYRCSCDAFKYTTGC